MLAARSSVKHAMKRRQKFHAVHSRQVSAIQRFAECTMERAATRDQRRPRSLQQPQPSQAQPSLLLSQPRRRPPRFVLPCRPMVRAMEPMAVLFRLTKALSEWCVVLSSAAMPIGLRSLAARLFPVHAHTMWKLEPATLQVKRMDAEALLMTWFAEPI